MIAADAVRRRSLGNGKAFARPITTRGAAPRTTLCLHSVCDVRNTRYDCRERRRVIVCAASTMAIRRFHQKSRSGCTRCKARRVKVLLPPACAATRETHLTPPQCDETKPVCRNCQRQGTECVYGEPQPSRNPTPRPGDILAVDGCYDALDLLLMHRWATVTALQLTPSPHATRVWQAVLPASAQSEPLLMHGILALAGMDLARLDGEDRVAYRARALHHQQMGLAKFQSILAGDAGAHINATFPFSLMLIILAYASVQSEASDWSVDAILDLFMLYRGPRALARAHWTSIEGTQLHQLLQPGDSSQSGVLCDPVKHQLQVLRLQGRDEVSQAAMQELANAIESSARGFDLRLVGRWPTLLSEDFFARLRQHQPEALVILSHYSIVLSAFRERWWIGHWDRVLLTAVARALPAEEQKRYDWSIGQMESVLDQHAMASKAARALKEDPL